MGKLRKYLWIIGLFTLIIGDIVTTIVGLEIGTDENNPFVYMLLQEYGYFGLIISKIPTLTIAIIGDLIFSKLLDSNLLHFDIQRYMCKYAIPLTMSIIGIYIVISNSIVIAHA